MQTLLWNEKTFKKVEQKSMFCRVKTNKSHIYFKKKSWLKIVDMKMT